MEGFGFYEVYLASTTTPYLDIVLPMMTIRLLVLVILESLIFC